jgi:lysine 2,3-aminomutase
LKNVIRDEKQLGRLVKLTDEEKEGIHLAKKHGIPFGITPYYCSLMDYGATRDDDHAIRAQVIPSEYYVQRMVEHRRVGMHSADFMMEHETSPVKCVVRRYPRVAIFKPYDTCAQICVYCQRNWEIRDVLCVRAIASKESLEKALRWFEKHPRVHEVLVTGGDPLIMSDERIEYLLQRLSKIKHVERIRIGTRTPVVLPMRFTPRLSSILSRYHNPPRQEVCLVSHYEHAYEVTPESSIAVKRLKKSGLSVYNQMVFTLENSRRFEAVATRLAIKKIGVDPYYTFMMKGKEETAEMAVPIARALQEQKEDSRLMPGLVRTDETVYNVPRLGKNYIRGWQDHDIIMILPNGSRVIEFHPWEKNISLTDVYVEKDMPIYDYMMKLAQRGENLADYSSIWYYY